MAEEKQSEQPQEEEPQEAAESEQESGSGATPLTSAPWPDEAPDWQPIR